MQWDWKKLFSVSFLLSIYFLLHSGGYFFVTPPKQDQNQNQIEPISNPNSKLPPCSTLQPILNYMHENKLDLRWAKVSLSGLHYNDQDKPRSCHLSPEPFVEVVTVQVTVSPEQMISHLCECGTGPGQFVMRTTMSKTVWMKGEYEVHAGYYRSPQRGFSLTLVGWVQEIGANMSCCKGVDEDWRILKIGASSKLEDVIFHYDKRDEFAFKLPQMEGNCWNFEVGDLTRNMTPEEWEFVGSNMVGSLNAALPREAYWNW